MTLSMSSFLVKEVKIQENITTKTSEENGNLQRLQDFQTEINWDELVDATFPHHLESGIGSLIIPTETMLKVYFLQHRYGMLASDIEKALTEIDALREFALMIDVIPKASCIRAFASLLQETKLSTKVEKAFTLGA